MHDRNKLLPRRPRIEEQGTFNHVTARGSGRRQLFEDDRDKEHFSGLLKKVSFEEGCSVFAWCLMDNHVHLLLQGAPESISKMMQRLLSAYAHWFNGRHGHIGHVFQGRYASIPINEDEHFLAAVRYIHMNPYDMSIEDAENYPWSSYRECLSQADDGICRASDTIAMFGGVDSFRRSHDRTDESVAFVSLPRRRLSDAEGDAIALRICGERYRDTLPTLAVSDRNALLARLRLAGLSVRQIERLTGLGRGVIAKARL